ncbi:MAG: NAD(+)/NADH kinase [Gemmatimonadales bacterium]|jgi:NAD+ kinase
MKLGVLARPGHPEIVAIVKRVAAACEAIGLQLHGDEVVTGIDPGVGSLDDHAASMDVILTLGGDGTLLAGARLAGPNGIPVIGCNLGDLGFLTAGPVERLEEMLERIHSGECVEEPRLALDVRCGDRSWYALNDAVVHKGGLARLLRVRVWVDGDEVGQYSADGIIVSTATGSTAYSLSAGGPILHPGLDALVATPICPHTLAIRPLVVDADSTIGIEVLRGMEGLVTVDGQAGGKLVQGERVTVRRSASDVRLLRLPDDNFFSVLRHKLRWGDVRPDEV